MEKKQEVKYKRTCGKCEKVFHSATLYCRHKKIRYFPYEHKCTFEPCCASFKAERNLKLHVANEHMKKTAAKTEEEASVQVPNDDSSDSDKDNSNCMPSDPKRPRTDQVGAGDDEDGDVEVIDDLESRSSNSTPSVFFETSPEETMEQADNNQTVGEGATFASTSTIAHVPDWKVALSSNLAGAETEKPFEIAVVQLFKMWGLPLPTRSKTPFQKGGEKDLEVAINFMRGSLKATTAQDIITAVDENPKNYIGEAGLLLMTMEMLNGLELPELVNFSNVLPGLFKHKDTEILVHTLVITKLQRDVLVLKKNRNLMKSLAGNVREQFRTVTLAAETSNEDIMKLLGFAAKVDLLIPQICQRQERFIGGDLLVWIRLTLEYLQYFSLPNSPTAFQIMIKQAVSNRRSTSLQLLVITEEEIKYGFHLHNFTCEVWGIPKDIPSQVEATYSDVKAVFDRMHYPFRLPPVTPGIANIYLSLRTSKVFELLIGNQVIKDVVKEENLHIFMLLLVRKPDDMRIAQVLTAVLECPKKVVAKALSKLSLDDVRRFLALRDVQSNSGELYDIMKSWSYISCEIIENLSRPREKVPRVVIEKFACVMDVLDISELLKCKEDEVLYKDALIPDDEFCMEVEMFTQNEAQ